MSDASCDETDCREMLELRRWAKEVGHYAFVDTLDRFRRLSPRVRAELRRKWREADEKK